MIIKEITIYNKELFYSFKSLITEELFNLLINSESTLSKMNEEEISLLLQELNKNLKILVLILKKIEKSSNFINNSKFNLKFTMLIKIKLEYSSKEDINNINLPYLDIQNKTEYLKFIDFLIFIYYLIFCCKDRRLVLSIFDPEFVKNSRSELELKYNKKQIERRKYKEQGKNTDILNYKYGKRIFSYSVPKTTYKNFYDVLTLATFSGFKNIYSKSVQQSIYAQIEAGVELNIHKNEEFRNKMYSDLEKNQRPFLAGVASTVFVDRIEGSQNLINLILNKNSKLNEKNYNDLNNINIQNIVYIHNDAHFGELETCPRFISLSENRSTFKFTMISLSLFSLVLSTILKEFKLIRKANFSEQNEILVNEDLTTNALSLYWNIFNFMNLNKTIFIFNNSTWNSVLENLYDYGLEISGGSVVKRHVLSPTDLSLSLFLSKFSNNGHKDVVISTNLLDKSIYQSRFTKTTDFTYNSEMLVDKIDKYADLMLFQTIDYLSSYYNVSDLNEDKEFIFNLKSLIVNEGIFINIPASVGETIFNQTLSISNIPTLKNILQLLKSKNSLGTFTNYISKARKNNINYIQDKLTNKKRNYSTNPNPILNKTPLLLIK